MEQRVNKFGIILVFEIFLNWPYWRHRSQLFSLFPRFFIFPAFFIFPRCSDLIQPLSPQQGDEPGPGSLVSPSHPPPWASFPSLCCRILRKLFGSKSPGVGPVGLAIKQTIFLREILVENRAIESFKEERYLIRQGDLSRRPSVQGVYRSADNTDAIFGFHLVHATQ